MNTEYKIKRISEIPSSCFEQYLDLQGAGSDYLTRKGISFAGISTLREGYCVGLPESQKTHMAIFTKNGEGYLKTPTTSFTLTTSSCVIVPVGQKVEFGIKSDNWEIIWFYLEDIPHWEPLHNKHCQLIDAAQMFQLHMAVSGYLTESNWNTSSAFTPYSSQRAVSLYAELIILYLEEALLSSSGSEDSATSRNLDILWQKIRTNPSADWNQDTMATEMSCSPSTLQRMVKRHYKITPWQMVIHIKMEQAKLLLEMTNYPLKVIADRLGYADEFVFSTAFKKSIGLSPKHHRNNAKAIRTKAESQLISE